MFSKKIKFILIFLLLYQTPLYSKSTSFNDYDSKILSKYFSGMVAFENRDNSKALDFFNSSKMGFIVLQGPHHSAEKSTNVRVSLLIISENELAIFFRINKMALSHYRKSWVHHPILQFHVASSICHLRGCS